MIAIDFEICHYGHLRLFPSFVSLFVVGCICLLRILLVLRLLALENLIDIGIDTVGIVVSHVDNMEIYSAFADACLCVDVTAMIHRYFPWGAD